MIIIGTPTDIENFYAVDDGWLITELHKSNCIPIWKDGSCVYFKKTNKLFKALKKLYIDIEDIG